MLRATFLERPNRFIAYVSLDGKREICHVKNTGRCRELLLPSVSVVLSDERGNEKRKTPFDLIAVQKGERLINIDSQAPNKAAAELLLRLYPDAVIVPEKTVGDSRLDFYIEDGNRKIFAEIKGVTLEKDGVVLFPDAPTERGIKHLRELSALAKKGFGAKVIFIIQMSCVKYFTPNTETHPQFATELKAAKEAGVEILAYECSVSDNGMNVTSPVPVVL